MNDVEQPALIPGTTPPTWLGVMGGGQLGRMFAQAAQTLGYRVATLEPEGDCPAGQVADRHLHGLLVHLGQRDGCRSDAGDHVGGQRCASLLGRGLRAAGEENRNGAQ